MKLRRHNQSKQTGRNPQAGMQQQTAPIMRYYRPEQGTVKRPSGVRQSAQPTSPRIPLTPRKALQLLVRWAGAVAVVFVLLANLTLSNFAILAAEGTTDKAPYRFRSEDAYREAIQDIMSGSLLNHTKLTLSSRKIEDQIRARLPEVDQVSVIIPLAGRKVQVKLAYAEPLMRLVGTNNRQGVVGANGVVFIQDEAPVINQSFADLPSLTMPNLEAAPGQQILTADEAALLALLKSEFDGSDEARPQLKAVEFMIEQRELRVHFTSIGYYAKLTSEERDARDQVGALAASLRQLKGQGKLPAEYIDVRVQGRVFVK